LVGRRGLSSFGDWPWRRGGREEKKEKRGKKKGQVLNRPPRIEREHYAYAQRTFAAEKREKIKRSGK